MINQIAGHILAIPRPKKRLVALCLDAALCVLTVWMALSLRLDGFVAMQSTHWIAVGISVALALPIFAKMGLYRAVFRYAGIPALFAVTKAVCIYAVSYAVILLVLALPDLPRTLCVLQPLLLLLAVGSSRALGRYLLSGEYLSRFKQKDRTRVLIYGAGSAGRQLAGAMANTASMRAIGFLDDDERLHGQMLHGLFIYNPAELDKLIKQFHVNDVLLAVPSASRKRRNEILEKMRRTGVSVRTLPGLMDLAEGRVSINDLMDLDIDDLLGRDAVPPHPLLMGKNIHKKVVLVTGAGGSIGSELCRQIIKQGPTKLLLLELSEFALYTVHLELIQLLVDENQPQVELIPLLASARDENRVREILRTWKPHTVYHAAAYKHVPMVEHNPAEGIKNNALGTWRMAKVAGEEGVKDFVLISTDKAVRPTNVMGASKRLAEMALQALAANAAAKGRNTRYAMVRFGNVLGSSGSVVPLFRKQIKANEPITLTHPDINRYFMSIPEAAQLVIQAGAMASGGDVFVLDMGQPVRIMDLAKRMVELSGLTVRDEANPNGDIEIKITGLRPGEKLYEELLIGDNPMPTKHPRIMKAHEEFLPLADLTPRLHELSKALHADDVPLIRTLLNELVPGYQPNSEVVDWVFLARSAAACS
jgi:FlaA1/EpsC-like NDP-sugar epimerase